MKDLILSEVSNLISDAILILIVLGIIRLISITSNPEKEKKMVKTLLYSAIVLLVAIRIIIIIYRFCVI